MEIAPAALRNLLQRSQVKPGSCLQLMKDSVYVHPLSEVCPVCVSVACDCDSLGSLNGGICDRMTDVRAGLIAGQCRCKANVEGERCERCREAHYGLSDAPEGCSGTKLHNTTQQDTQHQHPPASCCLKNPEFPLKGHLVLS